MQFGEAAGKGEGAEGHISSQSRGAGRLHKQHPECCQLQSAWVDLEFVVWGPVET